MLICGQSNYNIIMTKNKNEQGIDLSKYDDASNLSLSKINFGLWLSEKRKSLSKMLIIFLILISIFFFSFSTYNYVVYFLGADSGHNELALVSAPRNQVNELEIINTETLKINGYYDFITSLKNPNDRFVAYFNYCFSAEEIDIVCNQGFILPNEKKFLTALNKEIPDNYASVTLEIRDISWRRIDNKEVPNWNDFLKERLDFSFQDIRLNSSGTNNNKTNNLNYLEFVATNNTAYSYYEAPLNIIFYKDSQIIGAHRYVINNFLAGERRSIKLNWLTNLIPANKTEIQPEINILDQAVYWKYDGFRP